MAVYNTSSYKIIYIFSIPDEAHKGLVKIGDASIRTSLSLDDLRANCDILREAADKGRIKDYTFTAGIKVNLLWAQLAVRYKDDILNGKSITTTQNFRDHEVHNVLKNSGIKVAYPNGIKNREWFECDIETAKNAIKAVCEYREFLPECDKKSVTKIYPVIKLRREQKDAVSKTLKIFDESDKMLWNCKMRFGKTLTAYELIRSGNFQKTVVVTHRPVVEYGWGEDHRKLFGEESSHVFMKKQNLSYTEDYFDQVFDMRNDIALHNAKKRGDYFTYFASMQDLRGSKRAGGKFDKNNAVFDMDWDLIIYDEAHEGTQTDLGQTVQKLLENPKNGKQPKVLELSGTPYNIMDKYEDNVYTWDYVKEQQAKEEWSIKHPNEPNPYEDMPKMNIFTFDMSKALPTSYRFESETTAFNFREFFRVWTGDKEKDFRPIPIGKNIGDFVHEDDVLSFLNIISTESDDTKYPFATDEFRNEFKHTFWMVPGVKEAKALSALLKTHAVFSQYKVVNVAGEGDEELPYDNALTIVQEAIRDNPYTITISCGKLTTGVTVKEWTAVMMLTGSSTTDAKGYMQTIFRVQSAGLIDGKQKENCYVFDFAPDRALRVISESHRLSKKGKKADKSYKEDLKLFLNYCPIYAIDGVCMQEYNVNSMMRQIKRISVDSAIKSGFDDESIYKVDTGIVMDEKDREFFNALKSRLTGQKKSKTETKVTLADNGMTQAEYELAKKAERKKPAELTPEERAAREKLKEQKRQRETFISLLRNISIRLPLLIYGADVPLTENITMEKFVELVDDESWEEFLPTDVTKDLFRRSIKYFDEDVLIGAGLRIRRLVKQADEYPPTERIKRITELFSHFRNPDKETVLTPWRVVNMHLSDTIGGYCFLNEEFDVKEPLDAPRFVNQGDVTAQLFEQNNCKILEINSKSGLYPLYIAYSLYRNMLPKKEEELTLEEQNAIWNKVLQESVFVLCKTKMALEITNRTLAGFSKTATNVHYHPHLLETMQTDMNRLVRKIKNPVTWGKGGAEMKFDAIVGNPPYQISDGGAAASAMPIYNYFVDTSQELKPHYISMIMPARWYAGGKGLNEFRDKMLNDDRTKRLVDYANSEDCFKGVNIAGGLCYFLWDSNYHGNCEVKNCGNFVKSDALIRPLNDYPIFIRNNKAIKIIQKINGKSIKALNEIVQSYSYFAVRSYERGSLTKNAQDDVILISSKGKGYYSKSNISDRNAILDKFKVIITYAMSGGNKPSKEGNYQIVSSLKVIDKNEVCTETFLVLGSFDNKLFAENMRRYIATKFSRFLLLQALTSIHITKDSFMFVPIQDFTANSDIDWTKSVSNIDNQLYTKYKLSKEDISFIESMIKPME